MSLPLSTPVALIASIVALVFSSSPPPAEAPGAVASDSSVAASPSGPSSEVRLAAQGGEADVVLETPEVKGESVTALPVEGVSEAAQGSPAALKEAVPAEETEQVAPQAQPRLGEAELDRHLALLTPVRSASTFTAVGLTWKATAGVKVTEASVRVRENGEWTPWTALEIPEVGEDSGTTGRDGTSPLLSNGADAVQARVLTATGQAPEDLKIDLVNGGTAPAPRVEASASAQSAVYRPGSVAGDVLRPSGIVTRAQWGADESKADTTPSRSVKLQAMYIHHTASSNSYTPAQAAQAVRSFFLFHTQSRGWDDIGYQFLIDKYGTIYEGRRGSLTDLVVGAQAGGFNTGSLGVSMIGNYDTAKPSAAMLASLRTVLAWKGYANGIDVTGKTTLTANVEGTSTSRYKDGTRVSVPTLLGHRTTNYTGCPGQYLFNQLPSLRTDVKKLIDAAVVKYGLAGSPLKAPVAAASYLANQGVVLSGSVTLRWQKVAYAAKYQIMSRTVEQKEAFSRNGFWSAGATTTSLSKVITLKPGQTQVLGVRAIDAQGRPGAVTRLTQLTRPVSWATSAVERKDLALGGATTNAANGRVLTATKSGATATVLSVVGADKATVRVKATKGVTLQLKQGSKVLKTATLRASALIQTVSVALPQRGRANLQVVLSKIPAKASVNVYWFGASRPTFSPAVTPYVAPGAGQVTGLQAPDTVSSNGGARTDAASVNFTWKGQSDAAHYLVQVQRAKAGASLTGAYSAPVKVATPGYAVKLAPGESVRIRVSAVSVFGRAGTSATSMVVLRSAATAPATSAPATSAPATSAPATTVPGATPSTAAPSSAPAATPAATPAAG